MAYASMDVYGALLTSCFIFRALLGTDILIGDPLGNLAISPEVSVGQ